MAEQNNGRTHEPGDRARDLLGAETDPSAGDPLSVVPNRLLFEDRLEQATAQATRTGEQFAVHYVHLDDYQRIRGRHGESLAQGLLAAIAQRMSLLVRRADSFTLVGESEFAILQRNAANLLGVITLVQRLLDELSQPFWVENREIASNVSVGISLSDPELPAAALLAQARAALQKALSDSGHAYRFFGTTADREAHTVALLRDELHRAMDGEELCLHFQAQVDLRDGKFLAAEALARWRHPRRGLLAPEEFIPFAEGTRFIMPLGAKLLTQACRHHRDWEGDQELPLAVNVSAVQFEDPGFAERVLDAVESASLRPELLELELTESLLLKRPEAMQRTLSQLSERGVRFAIDDFGTGYSSLRYLRLLPLHKIKIAQEFVQGLPHNDDDVAIVSAVVGLAKQLGLTVIAEGVETEEQGEFLRELGCDGAQGFHYMHPEPPEVFADRLVERNSEIGT